MLVDDFDFMSVRKAKPIPVCLSRVGVAGRKFGKRKEQAMRYIQPQIFRTENAILAIQSLDRPANEKPLGVLLDNARNRPAFSSISSYEADE